MAKKIRFNMLMSNQPVRDRQELLEHFNIDDVLAWHKSGLLTRWLAVRDLEKDVQALAALSGKDDQTLARELFGIFFPDMSDADKHTATAHLAFAQERDESLLRLKEHGFARDKVIADYHAGYERILQSMLDNPEDYALIKAALREIETGYSQLFQTDFRRFFEQFQDKCILGLYALLANAKLRNMNLLTAEDMQTLFKLVPQTNVPEEIKTFQMDTNKSWELVTKDKVYIKGVMDFSSCLRIKDLNGNIYLSNELNQGIIMNGLFFYSNAQNDEVVYTIIDTENKAYRSFSGETDSYWNDIEQKGKQYLLLRMEHGNFVRSTGKIGEELSADDVNGKFPIVDGIDYKSNNASHTLVYLEV